MPYHFEKSKEEFSRAQQVIPGGVNSPARAFGSVGGEPILIDRAEGAYLFDIQGQKYIDYVGSWGPMILGHCHPAVTEALHKVIDKGTSYGAPTIAETELAEKITHMVPSIEKVRLVNSGTEATMSALRLARGYTAREKVIKFIGNYHGHVDSLLVAAGSAAATLGVPDSPGVTQGTAQDTILLPYNSSEAVEQAFSKHGSEIAAVIFEPVAGNMGCVPPTQPFLNALKKETYKHEALLICDEVMTGFRVATGGAQQIYNLTPDLTTLGKIVGGGLPVGAYGGRAEVMDHVLPVGKVFQAGTLSGNPLATAAGLATLSQLETNPPYQQLEEAANYLREGLLERAKKEGVECTVGQAGPMLTLFFGATPVQNWEDAAKCNTREYGKFFWKMAERGVYLPCSQYEVWFLSQAHTDDDLAATLEAAGEAFAQMKK
ncbi:MAG: glutamate-1-semialdehyde 2,1-aminomutase [Pirellulaceae bacterium]|nr:glutamate-1-semialdehyde 2,1-aminomutase [Pirellulaceae bacterium]